LEIAEAVVPLLLILGQERQRHAGERTEDDDD
jgi:hypothetical protein